MPELWQRVRSLEDCSELLVSSIFLFEVTQLFDGVNMVADSPSLLTMLTMLSLQPASSLPSLVQLS